MTETDTRDRIADAVLTKLTAARPSNDAVGAAVAAAALISERAAHEASDRDRVIRIARREGATLRLLAEATRLSRQTIANICKVTDPSSRPRSSSNTRVRAS